MKRGLSGQQIGLLGCFAAVFIATAVAIALRSWPVAALGAWLSFGLFAVFVVFTLAAMTRTAAAARAKTAETHAEVTSGRSVRLIRRIDDRYGLLSKQLGTAQARREAADRRLLATLEAHRLDMEKALHQVSAEEHRTQH